MKQHDNDNEPLSFIHIAAATANVVRYLEPHKEEDEKGERDPAPGRTDEQKRAEQREYVERRLKEIRAWERRISGK